MATHLSIFFLAAFVLLLRVSGQNNPGAAPHLNQTATVPQPGQFRPGSSLNPNQPGRYGPGPGNQDPDQPPTGGGNPGVGSGGSNPGVGNPGVGSGGGNPGVGSGDGSDGDYTGGGDDYGSGGGGSDGDDSDDGGGGSVIPVPLPQARTCTWNLMVKTGNDQWAPTDSTISMVIHNDLVDDPGVLDVEAGSPFRIPDLTTFANPKRARYFRRNRPDYFKFSGPCKFSRVTFRNLWNKGGGPDWLLANVRIQVCDSQSQGCSVKAANVNRWLGKKVRLGHGNKLNVDIDFSSSPPSIRKW